MADDFDEDTVESPCELSKKQWIPKLHLVDVYESDIQRLIMNYFCLSGYKDAASEFAAECKIEPEMSIEQIGKREKIREAILQGDDDEAIDLIDSIDKQILTENPAINFHLRKQKFFKLVEAQNTSAAIEYAQNQLAPCVGQSAELLKELETAMSLLAFDDINSPEAKKITTNSSRDEISSNVDNAILLFLNIDKEVILETLVKGLLFLGATAKKKRYKLPEIVNITNGGYKRESLSQDEAFDIQTVLSNIVKLP